MSEKILNHGFIELIEVLGSDDSIVNAARTSYDKGTKKVSSTEQLIRYLIRHKHSGPIEFGELVFRIRCPIFVARQWFRHRSGSYNEISLRYSEATDDFYIPNAEWITTQDQRNRQARTDIQIEEANLIKTELEKDSTILIDKYNSYLEKGVAREIARINLPLSLYTSFCYKSNLRNLLNFLNLRTDSHAQFEIRQYAEVMVRMVEKYFPITIQAWRDYMKDSIMFSRQELNILKSTLQKNKIDICSLTEDFTNTSDNAIIPSLEKLEFFDKLRTMMGEDITLDYLGKGKKN